MQLGGGSEAIPLAISPDGQTLALRRADDSGIVKLWLRPLDRPAGSYVGTIGGGGAYPFFSPDSRRVAFFSNSDGKLRTVDVQGGSPRTIADAPQGIGGTWNRRDTIVFAPSPDGPLFRVSAAGGPVEPVTDIDRSLGEVSHRHPVFLPDDEHFLYLAQKETAAESAIYVGAVTSRRKTRLLASTGQPVFVPPHHLLFLRETALMAQRLDLAAMQLVGNPREALASVAANGRTGSIAAKVSGTGVLVYRPGLGERRNLLWFDRTGRTSATVGSPDVYESPRLSPDGTRVAVSKRDPSGDLWIFDVERGGSTRLTDDPAVENDPLWSPDGTRIAYVSNRDGGVFNIYQRSAQGGDDEVPLLKTDRNKRLNDWSADGRYILYQEDDPKTGSDLWVLPLAGDRQPLRIIGTRFAEMSGSFSPDGRWLAYASDETGNSQVYVQPFPPTGSEWLISTNTFSATNPRWRGDGREVYFDSGGRMMVVDFAVTAPGTAFKAGVPRVLFPGIQNLSPPHSYDVSPRGDRFLVVSMFDTTAGAAPIVVETHWKPPDPP